MTTLIHGQARWGGHERTRDGSRDYDAHIIGAFGIAMIAVVLLVCTLAFAFGVDSTNLELMSVFP
jgi:hypothetical protein